MKGVLTLVCRMLGQVSDVLAEKLSASEKAEEPAKAGSGQQRAAGSTPLQDIFTVGQLVRCSIVALHDKDSSDGAPNFIINVHLQAWRTLPAC